MKLRGKKIFITGAAGFIGSHLTEALVTMGNDVTALVHYNARNDWGNLKFIDSQVLKNTNVVLGNIEDALCMQNLIKGKDVIFHLAALIGIPYSYIAPLNYIKTNVEGTLNVIDAALKYNIEKVVHTSTSETYGTALYTPIDEKHPLQGQSPYSASKIGADKMALSYYLSFDLPISVIRPFNTFGPRQSSRAVIPTIISQSLIGDSIKLGSLDPIRNMNYVKNTVHGFIKIAESDKSIGEVVNIGSQEAYTIGEISQMIFEIIGKDIKIVLDNQRIRPEKSEVRKLVCDNTKAKELLDWKEIVSFREGLEETVAWVRNNLDQYKTDIYNV